MFQTPTQGTEITLSFKTMKLLLPYCQLQVSLRNHQGAQPISIFHVPCPAPLAIFASSISISQFSSPTLLVVDSHPLPGALGTQERGCLGLRVQPDQSGAGLVGQVLLAEPRGDCGDLKEQLLSPERGTAGLPR